MKTNGIVDSQSMVKQSSQTDITPRRKSTKSIPVSHQKSESNFAWTLAKVALVAAAALGVGAAVIYSNSPTVPQNISQLDYPQELQFKSDLNKLCDTAVRNWCKTFPNQEYHCVAEYLDPNWKPQVSIEYGTDILCSVKLKPRYSILIGKPTTPGERINKFRQNHERIPALIPDWFKFPDVLKAHQDSWNSPENAVTFKSHFFAAYLELPAGDTSPPPPLLSPEYPKLTAGDIPPPLLSPSRIAFSPKNHSLQTKFANVSSDETEFPLHREKIGICSLT